MGWRSDINITPSQVINGCDQPWGGTGHAELRCTKGSNASTVLDMCSCEWLTIFRGPISTRLFLERVVLPATTRKNRVMTQCNTGWRQKCKDAATLDKIQMDMEEYDTCRLVLRISAMQSIFPLSVRLRVMFWLISLLEWPLRRGEKKKKKEKNGAGHGHPRRGEEEHGGKGNGAFKAYSSIII